MEVSYIFKEALRKWYEPLFFSFGSTLLRLVPVRPTSACINATHNCNSKCVTCTMWRKKWSGELTIPEMLDIMKQLKEIGIRRIGWSGGEPLLRQDLPLLIKRARELGFEKIGILTNGLILTEDKAKELLENGLNRISISLDGIGDAHDKQRGIKGAFEKTFRALQLLVNLRDRKYHNLDITASTTLTRLTVGYIPKVIEICEELNVIWFPNVLEAVSFQFRRIDKRALVIESPEEIDEIITYLHRVKRPPLSPFVTHLALEYARRYLRGEDSSKLRRKVPCTAGFQSIYIDAYGNVYPGCWAIPSVGSLRKNALEAIVFSQKYRERLYAMFIKRCPYCTNSLIMNIWYHIPSLLKEALWRLNS